MKLVISIESDGRLNVARFLDRKRTMYVLESAGDGNYFEDLAADLVDEDLRTLQTPSRATAQGWVQFVDRFVRRGYVEVLNV